jgi:transposase
MRGDTEQQAVMLTTLTPEDFVRKGHPVRRIKETVDRVLGELSPVFDGMYAEVGRPSVPPEHLLKASLLMALFSIRSERQFEDRLRSDLMFKWFLDLNIESPGFDATTFSKNRQRLLEHDVARRFFLRVTGEARRLGLLSDEHFSVDGTLLEAWASVKSFKPREEAVQKDEDGPACGGQAQGGGRDPDLDFRGQRRGNDTHVSATDPEARLARKGPGKEAQLSFTGHVLMENRSGMIVDAEVTITSGTDEPEAALRMLLRTATGGQVTVGADRGYDWQEFRKDCLGRGIAPHVALKRNTNAGPEIAASPGYKVSQKVRKRVEECFGWMKTVGGCRKLRYIGRARNELWVLLSVTAYNLVRLAKLAPSTA